MDLLVIKLGLLGFSHENGHPYSFSAIINGYEDDLMRNSGWGVIADYLSLVPGDRFGIDNCQITHVWTQDEKISRQISQISKIENICKAPEEMIGAVDGVIIARDDWESHFKLAKIFLERDIPVFVDKPLTLEISELKYFSKFLDSGLLMSCSGFRFATELEDFSFYPENLEFVSLTVVNDFSKYGIHVLEALTSIDSYFLNPSFISKTNASADIFIFEYPNGTTMSLTCLGMASKTFKLDFFGKEKNLFVSIQDNFGAFKETLTRFALMVDSRTIPIPPNDTIKLMLILIAGNQLPKGSRIDFNKFLLSFDESRLTDASK